MVLCNLGRLVTLPVTLPEMPLSEELSGYLTEDVTQAEPVKYRKVANLPWCSTQWFLELHGVWKSGKKLSLNEGCGDCRRGGRGLQLWIMVGIIQVWQWLLQHKAARRALLKMHFWGRPWFPRIGEGAKILESHSSGTSSGSGLSIDLSWEVSPR